MKSKLSTAKKNKTTTFSRVFLPKKMDNFLGKSNLNFWTKNEDLEQCALLTLSFDNMGLVGLVVGSFHDVVILLENTLNN